MPEGFLPGEFLASWGLPGLVLLAVLFGWLIPRPTHNRELVQANRRGDEWKAAYDAQDARNDAQAAQIAELLELARTSNAVIQSLQTAAERSRQDRGRR